MNYRRLAAGFFFLRLFFATLFFAGPAERLATGRRWRRFLFSGGFLGAPVLPVGRRSCVQPSCGPAPCARALSAPSPYAPAISLPPLFSRQASVRWFFAAGNFATGDFTAGFFATFFSVVFLAGVAGLATRAAFALPAAEDDSALRRDVPPLVGGVERFFGPFHGRRGHPARGRLFLR